MGLTVRRPSSQLDTWAVIPGGTTWVDYSHQRVGEDLVVHIHTFRRVRERFGSSSDLRLTGPAGTGDSRRPVTTK